MGGGNIYINELFGGAGGGGQTTKFSEAGMNLGVVNSAASPNFHYPAGLAWSDNRINSAAFGINYLTSSGPDAGPAATVSDQDTGDSTEGADGSRNNHHWAESHRADDAGRKAA